MNLTLRWAATCSVLTLLLVPATAGATTGYDTETSDGGNVTTNGGNDSETSTSGGEDTGAPATDDGHETEATTGEEHDTEHDSGSDPADDKGCSIGAGGASPAVLLLGLIGLWGPRRRAGAVAPPR